MTTRASGTFEVKLVPQNDADAADGIALARMTIDKVFDGDLQGTSRGQMLTSAAEATGSAAYVAMERVTGTLGGRRGSFALMHSGSMNKNGMTLAVTVAPESGTGELAGIAGNLQIIIKDKSHFYEFDYTIGKTVVS